MAGVDLYLAGKGWLVSALLCIACTLTGAPAVARPGGVSCAPGSDGDVVRPAVWDLRMCSMCTATDRAPLSTHVQDIFAA